MSRGRVTVGISRIVPLRIGSPIAAGTVKRMTAMDAPMAGMNAGVMTTQAERSIGARVMETSGGVVITSMVMVTMVGWRLCC